ncbi:MAG: hypothetical protein J5I98_26090 [Phaeodactylibacter sp.]|nr:hypothetical protein [Phaeodactylibacter sp.]
MAKQHNTPGEENQPKNPPADLQAGAPAGLEYIKALQETLLKHGDVIKDLLSQRTAPVSGSASAGMAPSGSYSISPPEEDRLKKELDSRLDQQPAVSVAFPPCTDVMLSLFKFEYEEVEMADGSKLKTKRGKENPDDEVARFFLDYFGFFFYPDNQKAGDFLVFPHKIFQGNISAVLDEGWAKGSGWPPAWCFPASYVTLRGQRHFHNRDFSKEFRSVKRLFLGDVVWLFFMERMGMFQILGKVLDEYAYNGGFPISNGSADPGPGDDLLALVLEAMTRQMEMGTASKVRDRSALYRTALGWILENGRSLGLETSVNTAFNNQFHKFINLALEYYKEKRLRDVIQATTSNSNGNGATMVTIRSTMNLLKKSFDNFSYGRNYYNALSGIVWAVASFAVIRDIRETIGIPRQYNRPYEYIPAAYDLLVLKRPSTPSDTNRFETHYECATNARDILIDIELLESSAARANDQEIEAWLSIIETKVEGYRSAYRALTGVDLGTTLVSTQNPAIEQQV